MPTELDKKYDVKDTQDGCDGCYFDISMGERSGCGLDPSISSMSAFDCAIGGYIWIIKNDS